MQKIKEVIHQWSSNKSPGPDGFIGEFFKKFCDVLIKDIHLVFQKIIHDGMSLKPLNTSYIVLIPKKEHARRPEDFRPMSLIHAIQKKKIENPCK